MYVYMNIVLRIYFLLLILNPMFHIVTKFKPNKKNFNQMKESFKIVSTRDVRNTRFILKFY